MNHLRYNSSNVIYKKKKKMNSKSHCQIKKIQHNNSHFKSQNFEEGSKSQHNQQSSSFFNDQGFWKYEMQNRKQALNMFLKIKRK